MPQGNPTPPLVGGVSVRDTILQSYVFQSGIHKPEHSSILTYKYPQYYMTSLLDRIGASEATTQDVFSWSTLDRTREAGTVSSITAASTTVTFEVTEFDYTAGDLGGLIVGDIIQSETGSLLRVTVVAASTVLSNKQKVSVTNLDPTVTVSTAMLDNAMVFGHVFNNFAEGSDAPNGRLFLPTEDYNVTTILRRSFKITGSEFTNKTYLGDGKAWYWTIEEIHRKEFARERELLVLFGKLQATGTKLSRGIIDWVTSLGVVTTYASASGPVETDLMEHIRKLRVEGCSSELLVLCGSKFYKGIQIAFRDYFVGGGINLGSTDSNNVGLNVRKYDFMGVKVSFVPYELFDDRKALPFAGTPTAAKIDYQDYSLWLDLGNDSGGKRLITLKYKEHGGFSRKFIQKLEVGMMNPSSSDNEGGMVASGFDGFRIHMLSDIGIEVRLANRMGIMRANS